MGCLLLFYCHHRLRIFPLPISRLLRPSSLDNLSRPPVILAQHRPARTIRLGQRHLHLRAHDFIP